MSVQSGMISEPPVNVNDSDHSAVTWLSMFFYSLGAGARVARFRRGKRKQQHRQKLRQAHLMVLRCHGNRQGPSFCHKIKQPALEGQKVSVLNENFLKSSFPIRSNFKYFSFLFSTQKWNLFSRSGIYST